MAKRSKDELGEIAAGFGVELDLTRPWADLNTEVQTLENGGEPSANEAGQAQPEEPAVRRFYRNRHSGQIVPYLPIFSKNQDLDLIEEPIEPEAPAEE